MLAKSQRLHTDKDYARLFAKGRAFHAKGVTMKAMKSKVPVTKVGFVVSTKVAKKANVRNLIKRRMREVVRKHYKDMEQGIDIAFMARPESKAMSFAELRASVLELLVKSGILPKSAV